MDNQALRRAFGLKRQLQRTLTSGNNALRDAASAPEFEIRCEQLPEIMQELAALRRAKEQLLISTQDNDTLLDREDELHEEIHEMIIEIKGIERSLHTLTPYAESTRRQADIPRMQEQVSTLKLAKLSIPAFSGDISSWTGFSDLFRSLVHERTCYSNAEKFQYLKLHLKDEPLRLVQNLRISDASYAEAWRLLERRYDNPRLIIDYHIDRILQLEAIQRPSYESLNGFLNAIHENLAALRVLNVRVEQWDQLLLSILRRKHDSNTRRQWEIENVNVTQPTVAGLISHLENAVQVQRALKSSLAHSPDGSVSRRKTQSFLTTQESSSNTAPVSCVACGAKHPLYKCSSFQNYSVAQRLQLVERGGLCVNCLSQAHPTHSCRSTFRCRNCRARHHSLLHRESPPTSTVTAASRIDGQATTAAAPADQKTNSFHLAAKEAGLVMLGTLLIETVDVRGQPCVLRALLDCASQQNYITRECAGKLSLPSKPHNLQVYGLGMTPVAHVSEEVNLIIRPVGRPAPEFAALASITDQIGGNSPQFPVNLRTLPHIQHLRLADPHCGRPDRIDMLLGAKLFAQLLLGGRVIGPPGTPAAIETSLGWVIIGEVTGTSYLSLCSFHTVVEHDPLSEVMRRFWEIEEVQPTTRDTAASADDAKCEQIYLDTTTRDIDGRYTVALPFKEGPPVLGDSYQNALSCYRSLRRRLLKNPVLRQQYNEFLRDFLQQGHMELVENPQVNCNHYYIPHLHVLRPESTSTKLRVVFNASKRTMNGVSLNDTLLTGPPLQADIRAILLRFRVNRFAFIGDLKQMFRQIKLRPDHRRFQQILWNFQDDETPQIYELTTVTFGMSCSPYLAQGMLHQLADDEQHNFPLAAEILKRDAYVDDIITGHQDLEGAVQLRDQLVALCSKGGFKLCKFATNEPRIFSNADDQPTYDFDTETHVKVLGVHWSPSSDTFSYRVNLLSRDCTKRTILSQIARVCDPLGWLTPVSMFNKRLLQLLWTLALDWDETPPKNVIDRWLQFQDQLPLLSSVGLRRCIWPPELPSSGMSLALIGFCDASEAGYAAVLYAIPLPFRDDSNPTLLYAKGRVAPLKRISIPRLELCAAALLARLIKFVQSTLLLDTSTVYAFSDSTVALTWIRAFPHRWKTFVSNRVTQIQESVPPERWYHVCSDDNPADVASRGVLPADLVRHSLWWQGPAWLSKPTSEWPLSRGKQTTVADSEARNEETALTLLSAPDYSDDFIMRQSSLPRLLRVTAYCRRFIDACRRQRIPTARRVTVIEMNAAMLTCISIIQRVAFASEMSALRRRSTCSASIRRLDPFLDAAGIIRVGGRLHAAKIQYRHQHPVLLPAKHHFTNMLIDHHHRILLHAGPQALQAALASRYWILAARQRIRSRILKCLSCFRAKPTLLAPKMGNLPEHRVVQLKPFEVCGTDMAGPINVVWQRSRGARPIKCYFCVFVCFSTKAAHLELVTDLSSDAFLAALRRFTARRGRVSHIYSDCGRNFIGAHRVLNSDDFTSALVDHKITWHFNPPSAPHFGGIWEACVKSVKHHLTRVIGDQLLTYEEMTTLLTEVEGQLNSRPLTPASTDPNDLTALTPGHFLVTEPINSLFEPSSTPPDPIPLLKRWTLISQLRHSIWKRWRREYLHTLQQRARWHHSGHQLQVGELVLVHDDSLPPSKWRLGRITRTMPGTDGIVRTAEIRTATGMLLRPAVKLSPLPLDSPEPLSQQPSTSQVPF